MRAATPKTDAIVAYKQSVTDALESYFASADIADCLTDIADIDIPAYSPYFLKKTVRTLGMSLRHYLRSLHFYV